MLDEKFILRRIQNHVDNAINAEDGDVTNVRQAMFARYMGDMYGNEREGYSKYRSREVLQAVEWALPSLMRVFLGGVKPVEFRASGPQDVDQAKLETDAVSYWFYQGETDESGFMLLYTWLKDILLAPNGYVEVDMLEEAEEDSESFEGVNDAQIEALEAAAEEAGDEVDIEYERSYTGELEGVGEVALHDITVTTRGWKKRPLCRPIPPDCCLVDHDHATLDLDSAAFVAIRTERTYSDLLDAGYDADMLDDLGPGDDNDTWNDENVTRHFYADEDPDSSLDEYATKADRKFWVHRCWMRIDMDEDGRNELRHIVMAGCRILENEPADMQPVVAASAIPIPHKHIGMSYAEIVADLQELMTTLTRQLLDNIYKQNVQRTFISESALLSDNSTMDKMLDGRSEVIPVRGRPAEAVMPEVITPIVAEITGVLDQLKDQSQLRTGVAPQLSLDPSTLEKATMGAFVGALEQASQRLELLARLFAETGLKRVFQKLHHTLRKNFDKPQPVEIAGQWVEVDPSKWRKRGNIAVNVGLGFNNKQMMLTLLTQLLQIQKEALQIGVADAAKIYATLEKLIEQANLGHAGTYFLDPRQPGWKEPEQKPDPAALLAQAQVEALKREADRKDKESAAEIARKDRETEHKVANDAEAAEAKAAELNQRLIEWKGQSALVTAQIAEIKARITSLNRADKNQAEPAEDSSTDEFDTASTFVNAQGEGNGRAKRGADTKADAA